MSKRIAWRALATATDTACAIGVVEACRILYRVPSLRAAALWSTSMFASMGVALSCVLPVALIVCAVPAPPAKLRAPLAFALGIASAALVAMGASSVHGWAFAALVTAARAWASPESSAGFARRSAAAFALLFAALTMSSSHVLRTRMLDESLVVRAALAPIAAALPAPALARAIDGASSGAASAAHTLTLSIELTALEPELALSMGSTQLVARNGAVLVDARRSTSGRTASSAWEPRFRSPSSSVRYVRCATDDSIEPCALAALADRSPLALSLRFAQRNPSAIDGKLASVLRAAHARTPLSQAIVALSSEAAPSDAWLDDRNSRALVILSARSIRPGVVRGAVRVDEVAAALDAIASHDDHPVLALAQRRAPWFDRTVVLETTRGSVMVRSAHSARYSLVVAPSRWGVALFDHELDPFERTNRADLLRTVVREMAPSVGARL